MPYDIIILLRKIFDGINVHLTCYFMMGIPGETKDDILKTLSFAYEIKPDFISISVYEIFPGTKLHRLGIEENTAVEHMEIEDYFKIQPHNYFYANYKRHLAGMTYGEFDSLEKYIRKKIHKYNRSPRNIYLRIKARSPIYNNNIRHFFDDVKKFIKWIYIMKFNFFYFCNKTKELETNNFSISTHLVY